jgi:hypothetical protein
MKAVRCSLLLGVVLCSGVAAAQNKEMPPGLWQITSKMEVPNMPPEMAAKMGQGMTFNMCVQPGDQRKWMDGAQRGPMGRGERQCEPSEMKQEGNKVSWKVKCADGSHGEGSMSHNGKDAYTMNMTFNGQRGSMTMQGKGKKIADTCDKSQSGPVR